MSVASEIRTLRRLAATQGLRLSRQGEDFYLIDTDTTATVLGWSYPGGVHLDEVKAYLRAESQTLSA